MNKDSLIMVLNWIVAILAIIVACSSCQETYCESGKCFTIERICTHTHHGVTHYQMQYVGNNTYISLPVYGEVCDRYTYDTVQIKKK